MVSAVGGPVLSSFLIIDVDKKVGAAFAIRVLFDQGPQVGTNGGGWDLFTRGFLPLRKQVV